MTNTTLLRAGRIVAASALFALAACVPQTEVVKLYEGSDVSSRQFERLLVVSVMNDTGARRRLEELIADGLASDGVAAIAGYTVTGLKPVLLQDEINAAAREAGADGILVSHMSSISTQVDVDPDSIGPVAECRAGSEAEFSLYENRELKEPESVRQAHTIAVVTNLYDTASGERLWTIQSTCFEKATMDDVLQEEARAIVRQLRTDRLVGQL